MACGAFAPASRTETRMEGLRWRMINSPAVARTSLPREVIDNVKGDKELAEATSAIICACRFSFAVAVFWRVWRQSPLSM